MTRPCGQVQVAPTDPSKGSMYARAMRACMMPRMHGPPPFDLCAPRCASRYRRYSPCRALDFELEIGCFVGPGNAMGEAIPVERAQVRYE